MKYKVALLLKEHFSVFFKENVGFKYGNCDLTYFEYENLSELKEIYEREQFNFDGFITSYVIPMTVLKRISDSVYSKPIISFDMDAENMYRIILQIILKKKELSDVKIGIDYLDEKQDLRELIQGDFLNEHIRLLAKKMSVLNFEELIEFENGFLEKYSKLIEEDKIDVIVTFFYSVIEKFKSKGIECHYVYPGKHNIEYAFRSLERSIQMQEIQRRLPGVIYINPMVEKLKNKTTVDVESLFLNIIKTVEELSASFSVKPIINRNYLSLEIYIDAIQLQRLTRNYTHCYLLKELTKRVGFDGIIGYGVGKNLYNSLVRAIDASKYALAYKNSDEKYSVLIDIKDEVYILSEDDDDNIEFLPQYLNGNYISEISQMSKLSVRTINKVIGFMQDRQTNILTTQELADFLGITKRGANKTLSALVDSGLAEIEDIKHGGEKGRPENIYKLYIEYK